MKWFSNSSNKESEDYEKEYLAQYRKKQKVKPKKKILAIR